MGPGDTSVTIVSSGTVTLEQDGYLPVTVTCDLSMPCKGSLIATDYAFDGGPRVGRSDLQVDPGATLMLGVKLPDALVAFIRSNDPPCSSPTSTTSPACPQVLSVLTDVGPSFGCDGQVYEGETQRGFPPCGQGPVKGYAVMSTTDLQVLAAG